MPLTTIDRSQLQATADEFSVLRQIFTQANYTEVSCAESIGVADIANLREVVGHFPPHLASPPATTLELLVALFLLRLTVPTPLLTAALNAPQIEALTASRLLTLNNSVAISNYHIYPCQGMLIATDERLDRYAHDQVMWLSPDSYELARRLPISNQGTFLDIGTGSGVHALLALRQGMCVTAIDNNPRAGQFLAFNTGLNASGIIPFVQSDVYSSLPASTRFDLIVAHPPFSPTPDYPAGLNYWSGGRFGDEILARILRGLHNRLQPRGTAILALLLALRPNESGLERLQSLLGDTASQFAIECDLRETDYWSRGVLLNGESGERIADDWRRIGISHFQRGTASFHVR